MKNRGLKSMFKYGVLFLGLVFSGSAFSTVVALGDGDVGDPGVAAKLAAVSGAHTGQGAQLEYEILFDSSLFPDFTDATGISLDFVYGLFTSGVSMSVSATLNGELLNTVSTVRGYALHIDTTVDPNIVFDPGYEAASFGIDPTYFTDHVDDRLVFSASEGGGDSTLMLIGQVELNYTPGIASPPVHQGTVPVPATLLLMITGMLGLVYTRKNRV